MFPIFLVYWFFCVVTRTCSKYVACFSFIYNKYNLQIFLIDEHRNHRRKTWFSSFFDNLHGNRLVKTFGLIYSCHNNKIYPYYVYKATYAALHFPHSPKKKTTTCSYQHIAAFNHVENCNCLAYPGERRTHLASWILKRDASVGKARGHRAFA